MHSIKGLSAASGIVEGVICVYESEVEDSIPHYGITPERVITEVERLQEAFTQARKNMEQMVHNAETLLDKQTAEILKVHLMILSDPSLMKRMIEYISQKYVNAEHAIKDVFDEYMNRFKEQPDHFRELSHDYIDIRDRLFHGLNYAQGAFKCEIGDRKKVIVATKRLTPHLVLTIPRENVLAFIAEEGGLTSHATIIARSFHVPILFGVPMNQIECGMQVIVDGALGKLIIDADTKTHAYYSRKMENLARKRLVCEVRKHDEVQTKTGMRISLKVNVSTPAEMEMVKGYPYDGIGLLRTEFLFMERAHAPTEDEQYELYRSILKEAQGKPVTVRLLDISTDKLPPFIALPKDCNLDLTLRGALAVEAFRDLFITQAKALLRANEEGNLRILYPMVSDSQDIATYRSVVSAARRELKREKKKQGQKRVPEGIMVETPAAVMLIEELLSEIDFINIGSNDLLQYTLAANRGNRLVEERYHIVHPAVLRMIMRLASVGKKAKKEVCLCGEIASFEEYYPLLMQAGIRTFSVAVSKFDDIKCALLYMQHQKHKDLVKHYVQVRTKKDADKFFAQFI